MNYLRKLCGRLWAAHLNFQEHEGTLSAAGIAYYVALSFFPLLLVLAAGLSSILQWTHIGQNAWKALRDAIAQQASPDLAQQVERSLKVVSENAPSGGPIGFLVLLASAIAIFAQLDAAFDRIWRLPTDKHASWLDWFRRLAFQRMKALGMLVGVGGFIVLVMTAAMVFSGVEHALEPRITIGPWVRWASSLWINLLLNLFAFTMIYRVVPRARVPWRDAVHGGLLTSLLWESGRQALTAYFLHLNYPTAYGIIGSFIAVMLWSYYAALVVLFGAEYVRMLGVEEMQRGSQGEVERGGLE
jgi:membrane protein